MREVKVKIYRYKELDQEAQKKAYYEWLEYAAEYDWYDGVYEIARDMGIDITEFYLDRSEMSVSHNFELNELIRVWMDSGIPEFIEMAKDFYRRRHSGITKVDLPEAEDWMREEFLSMLRNEHDYLTSEERFVETCASMEWFFYADGKCYYN